jgi:hypothetical protein
MTQQNQNSVTTGGVFAEMLRKADAEASRARIKIDEAGRPDVDDEAERKRRAKVRLIWCGGIFAALFVFCSVMSVVDPSPKTVSTLVQSSVVPAPNAGQNMGAEVPSAIVPDTVTTVKVVVDPNWVPGRFGTAYDLCKQVYRAATNNTGAGKVLVVIWVKGYATDHYGKWVDLDAQLGEFERDAAEIRKYENEDACADYEVGFYEGELRTMAQWKARSLFSKWLD